MSRAWFRFAAALDIFLRPDRRGRTFEHTVPPTDTLMHVIESLGVPHTEIGTVTADEKPVDVHAPARFTITTAAGMSTPA